MIQTMRLWVDQLVNVAEFACTFAADRLVAHQEARLALRPAVTELSRSLRCPYLVKVNRARCVVPSRSVNTKSQQLPAHAFAVEARYV